MMQASYNWKNKMANTYMAIKFQIDDRRQASNIWTYDFSHSENLSHIMCVRVRVWERERERESVFQKPSKQLQLVRARIESMSSEQGLRAGAKAILRDNVSHVTKVRTTKS